MKISKFNGSNFAVENSFKLKIKKLSKNIRDSKAVFYLTHSKFATYADPDYLRLFEEELINTNSFMALFEKSMSSIRNPFTEKHSNVRGKHSLLVGSAGANVSERLLLNSDLVRIAGWLHDYGHFGFAHDLEQVAKKYLRKIGIVFGVHHNTVGNYILDLEGIHQRVLERLEKEVKHRPLTHREKVEYEKTYCDIKDAAACHNGEKRQRIATPQRQKTNEDVIEQYIKSFIEPTGIENFNSRTLEGVLVRFMDPISYAFYDFLDGCIRGLIRTDDSEYENVFLKVGFSKKELDEWNDSTVYNKKREIVRRGMELLISDLVENSYGYDKIQMSPEISNAMYDLIILNYDKVVKPSTRELITVLDEKMEKLFNIYTYALLGEEKLGSNKYMKKIRRHILRSEDSVGKDRRRICKEGMRNCARKEIEEVIRILNGEEPNPKVIKTNRRKRFEEDLKELKNQKVITNEVKEEYIEKINSEMSMSYTESKRKYQELIKNRFPNCTEEELEQKYEEYSYLRLNTFEEGLAAFECVLYFSMMDNSSLLHCLKEHGIIENFNEAYTNVKEYTPGTLRGLEAAADNMKVVTDAQAGFEENSSAFLTVLRKRKEK